MSVNEDGQGLLTYLIDMTRRCRWATMGCWNEVFTMIFFDWLSIWWSLWVAALTWGSLQVGFWVERKDYHLQTGKDLVMVIGSRNVRRGWCEWQATCTIGIIIVKSTVLKITFWRFYFELNSAKSIRNLFRTPIRGSSWRFSLIATLVQFHCTSQLLMPILCCWLDKAVIDIIGH